MFLFVLYILINHFFIYLVCISCSIGTNILFDELDIMEQILFSFVNPQQLEQILFSFVNLEQLQNIFSLHNWNKSNIKIIVPDSQILFSSDEVKQ